MTESRAFLQCFGRRGVEYGEFEALRPVVEHFREGNAGGRDPFRRESEAARVGWSSRSAIAGRPSPLLREVHALQPRFATVMFGTNDLESRSPRRFVRWMWSLLEDLERRGVVPAVSTIPPRGDAEDDLWVPRFNLLLRALTHGRDLPLYDLHSDMVRLPRRGLAADGLHANVLLDGGRGVPCDLRREGLDFGHNVRNLRVVQFLGELLRAVDGDYDSPAPEPEPRPNALPITEVVEWPAGQRQLERSFEVGDGAELRAVAVTRRGDGGPTVTLRRGEDTLADGEWGANAWVAAGRYTLRVEDEPAEDTQLLISVHGE